MTATQMTEALRTLNRSYLSGECTEDEYQAGVEALHAEDTGTPPVTEIEAHTKALADARTEALRDLDAARSAFRCAALRVEADPFSPDFNVDLARKLDELHVRAHEVDALTEALASYQDRAG